MTQILKSMKAHTFCMCLLLVFLSACKKQEENYQKLEPLAQLEAVYKLNLKTSILYLDSLAIADNKEEQLNYYIKSKNYFKSAEPILSFIDKNNYKSLNQPNILKVEEEDATDIKHKNPFGFQVLEEQLHDDSVSSEDLKQNLKHTKKRLGLIHANTNLKLKDYHILWLLRDEISRVALTGITGFDSPVLERSLDEAKIVYESLMDLLTLYKSKFKETALYNDWQTEIKKSIEALSTDFNLFDRYNFIKNHTHKQLGLLVQTQQVWQVTFPFEMVFDNEATSLFSNNTFNITYFSNYKDKSDFKLEKEVLGRKLFNDKRLSVNNDMSCASCHHKEKAFTDGLRTFPKQTRNTPTLTYAALQKSFFFDGRAGSLEGQVAAVVKNKNEFHSDLETMKKAVESDLNYKETFNKIYGGKINRNTIRHAIATYIRSLNTFNSKFDNNINDLENSLTQNEINGFNLFMGKAKCATCHFAPVFNGTVPPNYLESEFESIGVPKNNLKGSEIDPDLGRYELFETESRKHFFKTPTVRNIALTSPYMHNGVYMTLDEVMEFYNNGGGAALGIELQHQTLPIDALNLSEKEILNVISFMNALTDEDYM